MEELTCPPCACVGQEALRKIITTLAVKNEEIQSFIYSLKQMLLNVEVRGQGGARGALVLLLPSPVGGQASAPPAGHGRRLILAF